MLSILAEQADDLIAAGLGLLIPRAPALVRDAIGDVLGAAVTLTAALLERRHTPAEAADLAVTLVVQATESLQAASPLTAEELAHLEATARIVAVRIAGAVRPRRVRVSAALVRRLGGTA